MTATTLSETRPSGSGNLLLAILGVAFALGLLCLVLLAIGLTSYVRLSGDGRALRNSLMKSSAAHWDKKIEINIGSFTLDAARAGLRFVNMDPDARTALNSARGAEVGVYRLKGGEHQPNRAAMLSSSDDEMAGRGWDRLVGVVNRRGLVAVYVPKQVRTARDVKIRVVAMDDRGMVVVSARSDLEPLMDLALHQSNWSQKGELPRKLSAAFK